MIKSKQILQELENKKDKLKELDVVRIGLFGSFAKGEEHKKSDIDFLVTIKNINFIKFARLLILLEKMFKRKIDLVLEEDLRPELNYVKKETKYVRV
jgi:uncharacterized protein